MALHQAWGNAKQNSNRDRGKKKHLCSLDDHKASQITASKAVQTKSPRVKQKGVFPSFFLGRAFNSCTHIQGWLTVASAAQEECLWKLKEAKAQATRDVQSQSVKHQNVPLQFFRNGPKMALIAFDTCLGRVLKENT